MILLQDLFMLGDFHEIFFIYEVARNFVDYKFKMSVLQTILNCSMLSRFKMNGSALFDYCNFLMFFEQRLFKTSYTFQNPYAVFEPKKINKNVHCVKSVSTRSLVRSSLLYISQIWTECRYLRAKSQKSFVSDQLCNNIETS